jgi:hypothetical protein
MSLVKGLTPTESSTWKRGILVLFSFAGAIANSAMTGTSVDPNAVSSLLTIGFETLIQQT